MRIEQSYFPKRLNFRPKVVVFEKKTFILNWRNDGKFAKE